MIEALSRPETRTVKRGVIHYNNQHWTSDVLSRASDLEGEKVTVMVPVVRGFPLAVLDPKGAFVSLVRPAPSFGKIDIAGAKEAGRLTTLRHRGARELERASPPAYPRPSHARFQTPPNPPAP